MKLIVFLLVVILLSCKNLGDNSSKNFRQNTTQDDRITTRKGGNNAWIETVPDNIRTLITSFKYIDVRDYNCDILDEYFVDAGTKQDTEDLVKIDSIDCRKLFGDSISVYGSFCDSYLYSLEKPFLGMFPITVIQYFGVVERPLMLVLFDSQGHYLNSIEVADSYGETGGCLSSRYVNDSTMVQNFEWYDYGVDSLGNDIEEKTVQTQTVRFKANGDYIITDVVRNTK